MPNASSSARLVVSMAALAVVLMLAPLLSEATHLPDHRFFVLGFVTDVEGRPVAGARVVVTRLKTGLEHAATTERDGFYLVVLHIHDEDEGERLGLSLRGVKGEIRARFDTRDKKIERGTRVDVRADRLQEDRRAFAETLRDYLNR
jgi:hypothetical protein